MRGYRFVIWFLRLVVRIYFRRVEVSGVDHVPVRGGGLLVSWHPNGLVDPGLILTHFPRRVAIGARHGLFRIPLLGQLMRAVGAVPIYRAQDKSGDAATRRQANQQSLRALAEEVARGRFAALFPEGFSHDAPHLMGFKSGAARLYYQARARCPEGEVPAIVPVGLHYDHKRLFRSSALVSFHPPVELPAALDVTPAENESEEQARRRARELTQLLETTLTRVVHATEDWQLHYLMHRVRKLVRAERAKRAGAVTDKPNMHERVLGFARIWQGYEERQKSNPEQVAELRRRIESYDQDIRALSLEDHELDADPRLVRKSLFFMLALQVATLYLLLPPILVLGWLVNAPLAALLIGLTRAVSREKKDEATVKLLVGALLFPLGWVGVGVATAFLHPEARVVAPWIPDLPVLAGLVVALLSALGGATALRYLRAAQDTARAMRVRLSRARRARNILRLREERAVLCDAILTMAAGLELPGQVLPDGRVVEAVSR